VLHFSLAFEIELCYYAFFNHNTSTLLDAADNTLTVLIVREEMDCWSPESDSDLSEGGHCDNGNTCQCFISPCFHIINMAETMLFPESLRKKRGPQLSRETLDRWRRSNWARTRQNKTAWDLIHSPLIPTTPQFKHLFLSSPRAAVSEPTKSNEDVSGNLLRCT
jgi:hypothetical protein